MHIHHRSFDDGADPVFEVFDSLAAAQATFGHDERIDGSAWEEAAENRRVFTVHDAGELDI
uniref:hypothetical protein n=1 Tax=Amycolatopsis sp. CA-096443 TaxID=3239919 RepID=UPI003F498F70